MQKKLFKNNYSYKISKIDKNVVNKRYRIEKAGKSHSLQTKLFLNKYKIIKI